MINPFEEFENAVWNPRIFWKFCDVKMGCPVTSPTLCSLQHTLSAKDIELVREELSRRGSDWQYIFEMEHLPLHPTKPSLIEGRYPTVGHFEGKMFSSWACEPGCYSTKPVLKWITCPTADYLSSKMPNCQYSREVVGISFDQLEVEFYVQLTLYWVRGLPLICLWRILLTYSLNW